jgi:hypothetical protein
MYRFSAEGYWRFPMGGAKERGSETLLQRLALQQGMRLLVIGKLSHLAPLHAAVGEYGSLLHCEEADDIAAFLASSLDAECLAKEESPRFDRIAILGERTASALFPQLRPFLAPQGRLILLNPDGAPLSSRSHHIQNAQRMGWMACLQPGQTSQDALRFRPA